MIEQAERLTVNAQVAVSLKEEADTLYHERGITFQIQYHKSNQLIIGVTQRFLNNTKPLSGKELISLSKNFFQSHIPDCTIHIRPTPISDSPAKDVNHAWVQRNMDKHSISIKKMSSHSGIARNTMIELLQKNEFTDLEKAFFYYFFKNLE